MGLEKWRFKLWDGDEMIASLIRNWRPSDYKSEKKYEMSLYNFLHDNLSELQVTRQFANGRLRADIAVEGEVIIEIKYNLDTTAKYHRLLGQITDYEDWAGSMFIILCGTTDRNLMKELSRHIDKKNSSSSLYPADQFRLFEK